MSDPLPASSTFARRYGGWALVAGASEGLGAAFAEQLAAHGMPLLLLARRPDALESTAATLRERHGVEVRVASVDLADAQLPARLEALSADIEVGVVVYNAAFAPVGDLSSRPLDELLRVVDVNVRAPLVFAREFAPKMQARGRGAIVLMSSLAGLQGSPRLASYAASKAFNTVLAEGLWGELRNHGVDVLACCAGAVRTPGYRGAASKDAPGTLDADAVARAALAGLGRGPRVIPGAVNKLASVVMGRLLSRKRSVLLMQDQTRALTESPSATGPVDPDGSAKPSAT